MISSINRRSTTGHGRLVERNRRAASTNQDQFNSMYSNRHNNRASTMTTDRTYRSGHCKTCHRHAPCDHGRRRHTTSGGSAFSTRSIKGRSNNNHSSSNARRSKKSSRTLRRDARPMSNTRRFSNAKSKSNIMTMRRSNGAHARDRSRCVFA